MSTSTRSNCHKKLARSMEYIIFKNLESALAWQSIYMGWVYVPTPRKEYFPWFPPSIDPLMVMQHPATEGLYGRVTGSAPVRA